ncbi:SCO2400 family protein [Streptomyces shenzhenensis]
MDYCHPCRRHLNGALACPGCGTAAETLRASAREAAASEPAVPGGTPYAEQGFAADGYGPDGDGGEDDGDGDGESDGEGDEPPAG